MHKFFARLSRMKYIFRWGLMRNTIRENIAEHSLETGMIAHALVLIGNTYFDKNLDAERAAVLAMYHDATEIITGDMPTPIKYFAPEIRESYQKVEDVAAKKLLAGLPAPMQPEYAAILQVEKDENDKELWKYVKAADKLSAYVKCIEELSMGNKDFKKAEKTILKSLTDMQMDEVDFYLEQFIPAYKLTIDEQSRQR